MLGFYIAIALLSILGLRPRPREKWEDCVSRDQCDAIKGICILLVFLRHVWPYVQKAGYTASTFCDKYGSLMDGVVGQLMVAPFLFYSGYGIMESIRGKGDGYVRSMPLRRILVTLLNFDVAVCSFFLLNLVIGHQNPWWQNLLALTGWYDIGNSNWYIFDILACYLIVYIVFRIKPFRNGECRPVPQILGVGTILAVTGGILSLCKGSSWYNTLLCFPAGLSFSVYKGEFMRSARRHPVFLPLVLGGLFLLGYVVSYGLGLDFCGVAYNATSIVFCLLIILLTSRMEVGSHPLRWLGRTLFPLYIYQRIPMIVFSVANGGTLPRQYPRLYIAICLIATVCIAMAYPWWQIKATSPVFRLRLPCRRFRQS